MALTGAFLWLANVTRPDLAYVASQLARFVSNPAAIHYRAALRVLIYLRTSASHVLVLRPKEHAPLCGYVDADWATKFSVSGGLIAFLSVPVHWYSRTQRSVSMSSTESEYFAMCIAAKEVIFFRDLLLDLGFPPPGPTRLATDNKSVVDLASMPSPSRRPNIFFVLPNSFVIFIIVASSSFAGLPATTTPPTYLLSPSLWPRFANLLLYFLICLTFDPVLDHGGLAAYSCICIQFPDVKAYARCLYNALLAYIC